MVELPCGHCLSHAAIYGQDGSVWASSETFPEVTDAQIENIVGGFSDPSKLQMEGLKLGDTKYMMVFAEPDVIRGKLGSGKRASNWLPSCSTCQQPTACHHRRCFAASQDRRHSSCKHTLRHPLLVISTPLAHLPFLLAGGVTIKKTNSAVVIGVYAEPVTHSECNVVVENLGDYLKDQGL